MPSLLMQDKCISPLFPDIAVVVTDVENLKRNLLLFTQIKDLEIPTLLVINMADRMRYKGISLDIDYLEEKLNTKIAQLSSTIDSLTAKFEKIDQSNPELLSARAAPSVEKKIQKNIKIIVRKPKRVNIIILLSRRKILSVLVLLLLLLLRRTKKE